MKQKAEHRPLNYCPVDRRNSKSISMDLASIIAICTVLGTLLLSTVLVMALAEPVPAFEIKLAHPGLKRAPSFDKSGDSHYYHYDESKNYAAIDFCSSKDIAHGNMVSTIEAGGHLVSLEGRPVNLDAGCYSVSIPISIPQGLPPGEYTLNTKISGRLNAIKTYSVPFFSIPITVK